MLIRRTFHSAVIVSVFLVLASAGFIEAKKEKKAPEKGSETKTEKEAAIEPLIIWDGEDNGTRGNGWWSPKAEDGGKAECTLEKVKGTGHDSPFALVWKVKGPEWKGFGWNWFGWWPSDAGTDISLYSYLTFWVKFEFPSPDKGPALDAFNIGLSCSDDGGRPSADVILVNHAKTDIRDGEWHEINIPLKEIFNDDASREFNPKTVWELRIGQWTSFDQDFTAYFDSIGFK